MFSEIFETRKPVLIPFLMAGHPTLEASEKIASGLIDEGVSILELGIPFSDPLADGPVIQGAAELSLKEGTNLKKTLELCKTLTTKYPFVQIVLFTYLNPLLAYGLENYVRDAKACGAAATLTVDLPPEEAGEYLRYHRQYDLRTVFLASPSTDPARLALIEESSSAFVYYISRAGVTGEQATLSATLRGELEQLRKNVRKPIAVGFGISQPEHAKKVNDVADAVVIGSAFIRLITESETLTSAVSRVRELAKDCLQAMR